MQTTNQVAQDIQAGVAAANALGGLFNAFGGSGGGGMPTPGVTAVQMNTEGF